jgi:hypothetical protein
MNHPPQMIIEGYPSEPSDDEHPTTITSRPLNQYDVDAMFMWASIDILKSSGFCDGSRNILLAHEYHNIKRQNMKGMTWVGQIGLCKVFIPHDWKDRLIKDLRDRGVPIYPSSNPDVLAMKGIKISVDVLYDALEQRQHASIVLFEMAMKLSRNQWILTYKEFIDRSKRVILDVGYYDKPNPGRVVAFNVDRMKATIQHNHRVYSYVAIDPALFKLHGGLTSIIREKIRCADEHIRGVGPNLRSLQI